MVPPNYTLFPAPLHIAADLLDHGTQCPAREEAESELYVENRWAHSYTVGFRSRVVPKGAAEGR